MKAAGCNVPSAPLHIDLATASADRHRRLGPALSALADLRRVAPLAPTACLLAAVPAWTAFLMDDRLAHWKPLLTEHPVSLRASLLEADDRAGLRAPILHNLSPGTVVEGITELVSWASRRRRANSAAHLVIAVQRFLPGTASVLVPVSSSRAPLRLSACLGFAEPLLYEPLYFDTATVRIDGAVEYHVVDKLSATMAGAGGTINTPVPEDKRHAQVLSVQAARRIAGVARAASAMVPAGELEFVLVDGDAYLVDHRPW